MRIERLTMFNSYSNAYNNLKIHVANGTLIKSHPKSFTRVYAVGSGTADALHNAQPTAWDNGKYAKCVTLQTMILGDKLLMSEIVMLIDYLESEGVT
jgi:hypothetical protein